MTLETLIRRLSPVTLDELFFQADKAGMDISRAEIVQELARSEARGEVKCDLVIRDASRIVGVK